ncbi:MAG: RNA polymerase sporulation sigma factor SigK [Ruminococcaceae bacterium]|nr:RNA polymerase sporulation sigma factor SigK [Oscillospiraceae bacterium]MBD5116578.1 RNA polymerase sporulation sigma factor SigK [Oscillospiraceae bacterium]
MFTLIIQTVLKNLMFFALHLDRTNNFPKPLSKKEEQECIRLIAQGDEKAREKLIEHNLRLVAYIVKKHYSDSNEQEDLISIGTIGLIKAVETFSEEKKTNFSTYAGKCIDNQIKMYFRKIKHKQNEMYLDAPIEVDKEGNPLTIADIFKDLTDVSKEVDLRLDLQKLYRYINESLDEREKLILCSRYGLSSTKGVPDKALTQREVAEKLNISRSYVSRIEKKALQKLADRFEKND